MRSFVCQTFSSICCLKTKHRQKRDHLLVGGVHAHAWLLLCLVLVLLCPTPPSCLCLVDRSTVHNSETRCEDGEEGLSSCFFFFVLYFKKLNIHCPLQAVSTRSCSSSFSIFLLLQTILTPRSQARLGSGLSHS